MIIQRIRRRLTDQRRNRAFLSQLSQRRERTGRLRTPIHHSILLNKTPLLQQRIHLPLGRGIPTIPLLSPRQFLVPLLGPTWTVRRGQTPVRGRTPTPTTHLPKGGKGRRRTRIVSYKKSTLAIRTLSKECNNSPKGSSNKSQMSRSSPWAEGQTSDLWP